MQAHLSLDERIDIALEGWRLLNGLLSIGKAHNLLGEASDGRSFGAASCHSAHEVLLQHLTSVSSPTYFVSNNVVMAADCPPSLSSAPLCAQHTHASAHASEAAKEVCTQSTKLHLSSHFCRMDNSLWSSVWQ